MGLEFGLWNVDGDPVRLSPGRMALESRLEELIEQDSGLLGHDVLVIGRQVATPHGKLIDLVAIDADGNLHILELKRDRTPRDVVAQLLDYGSWAVDLGYEDIKRIYADRRTGTLEAAFDERFGASLPDELNAEHSLAIVASSLDQSTERIVEYLNRQYGVPINVVFFNYYEHAGHQYLARTWLVTEAPETSAPAQTSRKSRATAPWNGTDWYASFGTDSGGRSWEDARRFGFISAGGGEWYSRTLKSLPIGARVMVCIPSKGYVGVGEVTGIAQPFEGSTLIVDGEPIAMAALGLQGNYEHPAGEPGDDRREFVVPVDWSVTTSETDAFWRTGMFANQNSACKLRQEFTIEEVSKHFKLTA